MGSVLLVEDEAVVAMELQAMIEELNLDVVGVVGNGEEAVNLAKEHKPDIVFMDIRLTGKMDGIEAVEEIKQHYDPFVVYVTAYSDSEIMERAQATHPSGYLIKPVTREDLKSMIEIAGLS